MNKKLKIFLQKNRYKEGKLRKILWIIAKSILIQDKVHRKVKNNRFTIKEK